VTAEDPRRTLARHGLTPKKSFGQNFLVERAALACITEAVGAAPGRRVVEIGAGLGALTRALVEAGAEVIAIERDRDLAKVLREELGGRATIVEADAKTFDYRAAAAGAVTAVAGNLPYHLTAPLLEVLADAIDALTVVVVMVQREVADRLVARPGGREYGAASVLAQARASVQVLRRVAPGAFHPPPRVTSAIVRMTPLAVPRIGAVPWPAVRRVVRAAFQRRRKQLRNALGALASRDRLEEVLAAVGIDGVRRPETLTVEELAAIAARL